MLRKIRLVIALLFWIAITLLFLDFTGTVHAWFGWMAKVQFLPAVLALNVGVVAALVIMTLVLGRVYCSVICPLGVMQDFFAWLGKQREKKPQQVFLFTCHIMATLRGIGGIRNSLSGGNSCVFHTS